MQEKIFKAGEIIFQENGEGTEMYYISSGKVSVYKMINAEKVCLAEFGPGEVIGEMSLFVKDKRSATVQALETTRVTIYDRQTIIPGIRSNPKVACKLIITLINRLKEAHRLINQLEGIKSSYQIMYGKPNKKNNC